MQTESSSNHTTEGEFMYTIRGFLKPRLFEMREAVLRDEESHDVIIQFKSDLFWLRPMICGSHPKQRRLDLNK